VRLAVAVDILEQLLPGQVLTFLDEAREAAVGDRQRAHLARFGAVAKLQRVAADIGVTVAQGSGTEALVRLGIIFVADAQITDVEQLHDRGDGAFLAVLPRLRSASTRARNPGNASPNAAHLSYFSASRAARKSG